MNIPTTPRPVYKSMLFLLFALSASASALAQGSPIVDTAITVHNPNFAPQSGQVVSDTGPLGVWTVTPSNNNRGAIDAERFNGQGTTPSPATAGYLEHSDSFPNGISFSQELSSVAPGFALTLRYYHGAINVEPTAAADYRVEMSVGGETFFSRVHSLTPKQVNWQQVTETVDVPAHLSGPVTLRFAAVDLDNNNATISRVCIDNVSLHASADPAPSPESNAKLSDLVVSESPAWPDPPPLALFSLRLALSPGTFHSDVLDYSASIYGRSKKITVKPTAAESGSTILVKGPGQDPTPVQSGTFSAPIDLSVNGNGTRDVIVGVIAPDGRTVRNYLLRFERQVLSNNPLVEAPLSNSGLGSLQLDAGALSPTFALNRLSYTISPSVSFIQDSVMVQASGPIVAGQSQRRDIFALLHGAFVRVGQPLPLRDGANSIEVRSVAQDGHSSTSYMVSVVRESPNSDAKLSALSLRKGNMQPGSSFQALELTPAFDPGLRTYRVEVENARDAIRLANVQTSTRGATVDVRMGGSGDFTRLDQLATDRFPLVVGTNTLQTRVTATDGVSQETYSVDVVRLGGNNADLRALDLLAPVTPLTPAFTAPIAVNSGETDFTARVPNNVGSVRLLTATADPLATFVVRVNNNPVTYHPVNGATINLAAGVTTSINVDVEAQDGTQRPHKIDVTRAASSNNKLSALTVSSGTLSPAFASGTTVYTNNVANNISAIRVRPTAADSGATITVNGQGVTSGANSQIIRLAEGATTFINVDVTAQDRSEPESYTVEVNRAASGNNNLSGLRLSSGTLSPAFASGTTVYTNNVPFSVQSIQVRPTAAHPGATITVNGQGVTSGNLSGSIPLTLNGIAPILAPNVARDITVVVTAQDRSAPKAYTVRVIRAAPSTNANLAFIDFETPAGKGPSLGGVPLGRVEIPDPNRLNHTVTVGNRTDSLRFRPMMADLNAKYSVAFNGGIFLPMSQALSFTRFFPLQVGTNTLQIRVTAEDGVTRKTYTVSIIRPAGLASLALSRGTLSPAFDWRTTDYTASVGNDVRSLRLTPAATDSTITASVNAGPAASVPNGFSFPVSLNVGPNNIVFNVTSFDRTSTKIYTVVVTRAPSSNADLKALRLSTGNLSPSFAPSNTAYTASVSAATSSIRVRPFSSEANASLRVRVNSGGFTAVSRGQLSDPLPLNPGSNTVTVELVAQDGTTTKAYTITVTSGS